MTTAISLTDKEFTVLRAFAAVDYVEDLDDTAYVTDVHEMSRMRDHAFAGVYGSLVSKGLIVTYHRDPKNPANWFTGARGATLYPDTCRLTPTGLALLRPLLPPSE